MKLIAFLVLCLFVLTETLTLEWKKVNENGGSYPQMFWQQFKKSKFLGDRDFLPNGVDGIHLAGDDMGDNPVIIQNMRKKSESFQRFYQDGITLARAKVSTDNSLIPSGLCPVLITTADGRKRCINKINNIVQTLNRPYSEGRTKIQKEDKIMNILKRLLSKTRKILRERLAVTSGFTGKPVLTEMAPVNNAHVQGEVVLQEEGKDSKDAGPVVLKFSANMKFQIVPTENPAHIPRSEIPKSIE